MSKQRMQRSAQVGALVLTLILPAAVLAQGPAQGAQTLFDLGLDLADPAHPVVTLSSSGEIAFETFLLDGPDRLVLDLPQVVNRLTAARFEVGSAGVVQVRAAQHQVRPEPVTRVVFDLDGPIDYRIRQTGGVLSVVFGDEIVSGNGSVPERPAIDNVISTPAPDFVAAETAATTLDEVVRRVTEREELPELKVEAPEPLAVATAPVERTPRTEPEHDTSRAIGEDAIDRLLRAPAFASPPPPASAATDAGRPASGNFSSKTIVTGATTYSGKRISVNLVDAELKQVFRLFHEISGLNFVLDPDVSGRVTVVLDQVPWDQALDLILKNNGLDKVLENNVLRIASTDKLAREAASRKQLKEAEELEVEPITLTRTLSYAKAADVERVIRDGGILSPRGRVIVDERTNTLIISDIPKKVEPVDALISVLDAETPQVMIEARIVETSRNYTQDLGVTWGFQALADASRGTATGLTFPHNASVNYGLNLPGQGASDLSFSLSNIVDSFTLDLALNALESEGEGRVLSSPRVATQNNERAEIEQGVRIPVVNTTATEIDVEFVSASLLLAVTPQITAEGTIILDIIVENNSPDFINTAADIPSIRTQRAQTKVLINDGGTTVIGGIFTVNEGRSEIGVPWFRKLPVFGWLFRSQNITQENRELLIFITPKIVKLG